MVSSTATLFSRQGVEGTSLTDIIAASGAPRGSIYHHFPGGKAQLAEEAVTWAGERIVADAAAALAADDPVAAIAILERQWSAMLSASDFRAGCTVLAATLEGERDSALAATAAGVFGDWAALLAAALIRRGVGPDRAHRIATLVIAALEGAIVLCRAQRSLAPLESVAAELTATIAEAVDGSVGEAAGGAGRTR
jgi:AcrR family transcriptional regulator